MNKTISRECLPGTLSYTIKPGDTFNNIARLFNISPDDLKEANPDINPNHLFINQAICIPLPAPPVNCPPGAVFYTVKTGDTFYSIALKFNATVSTLANLNPQINPSRLLPGQKICVPQNLGIFVNWIYRVTFRYPAFWQKIDNERYEGSNGFFQISAISGEQGTEEACRNEAFHQMKPYGSRPRIIRTQIRGQEACLILPSANQPKEMKGQAALIVRYPNHVMISGQRYSYFILWADKEHIIEISDTLRFLLL